MVTYLRTRGHSYRRRAVIAAQVAAMLVVASLIADVGMLYNAVGLMILNSRSEAIHTNPVAKELNAIPVTHTWCGFTDGDLVGADRCCRRSRNAIG